MKESNSSNQKTPEEQKLEKELLHARCVELRPCLMSLGEYLAGKKGRSSFSYIHYPSRTPDGESMGRVIQSHRSELHEDAWRELRQFQFWFQTVPNWNEAGMLVGEFWDWLGREEPLTFRCNLFTCDSCFLAVYEYFQNEAFELVTIEVQKDWVRMLAKEEMKRRGFVPGASTKVIPLPEE